MERTVRFQSCRALDLIGRVGYWKAFEDGVTRSKKAWQVRLVWLSGEPVTLIKVVSGYFDCRLDVPKLFHLQHNTKLGLQTL